MPWCPLGCLSGLVPVGLPLSLVPGELLRWLAMRHGLAAADASVCRLFPLSDHLGAATSVCRLLWPAQQAAAHGDGGAAWMVRLLTAKARQVERFATRLRGLGCALVGVGGRRQLGSAMAAPYHTPFQSK